MKEQLGEKLVQLMKENYVGFHAGVLMKKQLGEKLVQLMKENNLAFTLQCRCSRLALTSFKQGMLFYQ